MGHLPEAIFTARQGQRIVYVPESPVYNGRMTGHKLYVAGQAPVGNLTQHGVALMIGRHPGRVFTTLYDDAAIRGTFGIDDPVFRRYRGTGKNGGANPISLCADFTQPCDGEEEVTGVGGQTLLIRKTGIVLPGGERRILGKMVIPPSGYVPDVTLGWFKYRFGSKGLEIVTQFRDVGIFEEDPAEKLRLTDSNGYAVFTMKHPIDECGNPVPFSHYQCSPRQEQGETVATRDSIWHETPQIAARRSGSRRRQAASSWINLLSPVKCIGDPSHPPGAFYHVVDLSTDASAIDPNWTFTLARKAHL